MFVLRREGRAGQEEGSRKRKQYEQSLRHIQKRMKVTVAGMQTAGGRHIEAREVEKMMCKAKHRPDGL